MSATSPAESGRRIAGCIFQARLRERGFDCPILVPERYPQSDPHLRWTDYQRFATDWLQALPPQTAVFAANDRRAMTILDICRIAGIRVPGDLAILGCDNDEILCENTTPPLSSVEPDFQTAGYQAAQTLDRLMAGAGADAVPVRQRYGVKRIVERVSTLYRPNALNPRTLAALDFIRLNAANEIGVADVAAHIRISRRSAELLFRRDLDQTIGHAIQAARVERMKTLLADTSGAMGYGVPAAIACAITTGRTVVALTGDGDFMMTGQELATARQYGARLIVVLVNNGVYGTIRMHQAREYPHRQAGSMLTNPDFVRLAESHGLAGERVERTEQFEPALRDALARKEGTLIEIMLSEQVITTRSTLEAIETQAAGR